MKCQFCNKVALLGSDPPTCLDCKVMFHDHLAIICEGCDTLYWLMKTTPNVMRFCEMYGVEPDYVMSNACMGIISRCEHCVKHLRLWGVSHESKWTH